MQNGQDANDGRFPDWAEWLAQDADGVWWAYEVEPNQHSVGWYENEVGRYARIGKGELSPDWQNSLRRIICRS